MAKDCIEREAALLEIEEWADTFCECDYVWPHVIKSIRKLPAADVRPVVMCCDCKHFQVNMSPSGYLPQGVPEWECRYWLRPTDPTDFCSYGEKWEES